MSGQVYVGYWSDNSYPAALAARLTIPSDYGRYLTAFIALFDTWAGAATWSLLAFTIYRIRSGKNRRDDVFEDFQVAYRNASSPASFVLDTITIYRTPRDGSFHAKRRALLQSLLPIIAILAFAAAGTFSSKIASSSNVLLKGQGCGYLETSRNSTQDAVDIGLVANYLDGVLMKLSEAYAQQCYSNPLNKVNILSENSDAARLSCRGYVRSALNFTVILDNDCPFQDACASPTSDVLKLDTGYLNSNDDLGLNQPLENQIDFRKVTTCSPLVTQGFATNDFGDLGEEFGNVSLYSYGQNVYQPTRFGNTQGVPYPNVTFLYSAGTYQAAQSAYYLMVASTMMNDSNGPEFQPLPQISSNPLLPMSLVFLANRAFYDDIVLDPWFNATSALESWVIGSDNSTVQETLYLSSNPGAVLACTEQLQVCNPAGEQSRNCTDLDTWYQWGGFLNYYDGNVVPQLEEIGLNRMQQTTTMVLMDAAISASVWNVVGQLGDEALIASNFLTKQETFWSPTLASNQWQIEVTNWFSIGLAQLQRGFVSTYRIPSEDILRDYWSSFPEDATSERLFCASQKVQNLAYTTFSVLGLSINFGIGGLLLIIGYTIPILVPWWQTRRAEKGGGQSFANERWLMDHALELSRALRKSRVGSSQAFELGHVEDFARDDTLAKAPLLRAVSAQPSMLSGRS